ncbi:hypothetical protein Hanom_Chr07g00605721 [Helianthus anomalus]
MCNFVLLMSIGDHFEDSEEMSVELPPLKWPRATFDGLIQNLKFSKRWGVIYPEEGQTTTDAPAGYLTLFWDFYSVGNFRLPVTKFFLEIMEFYKFHVSQMHPIGMVRVWHFEFVCRTMHIEPKIPCLEFFIKCTIPKEDVPVETIQTPADENWYQDLKDVPNITLLEKALVGSGMSLNLKMDREEKPVYMEDGKKRRWKMSTIAKRPYEELWYHRIMKNFFLPRDVDLFVQPVVGAGKLFRILFIVVLFCVSEQVLFYALVGELFNLGIGPEKKRRATTSTSARKKSDAENAQSSMVKNAGEKKGMRRSSDSWCDYVVVSDSMEGLTPVVIIRRPKSKPKGTVDIPPSQPLSVWCRLRQGKENILVLRLKVSLRRSFKGRRFPGKEIWTPLSRSLNPYFSCSLRTTACG